MYLKGAGQTLDHQHSRVVLYLHSSLHHRLEAEISEVLGNKTYVGEEELEKLQYTEQVCLVLYYRSIHVDLLELRICRKDLHMDISIE